MDTHEVLVAARNLIDREGWSCGMARGGGGARCAGIAIKDAAGLDTWTAIAKAPATHVLYRAAGLPRAGTDFNLRGGLAGWNDGSTKEEVLAAFDKAIAATAPEPMDPLHGVEARASFRELVA